MEQEVELIIATEVVSELLDADIDIVWPNTSYTPSIGQPFLRVEYETYSHQRSEAGTEPATHRLAGRFLFHINIDKDIGTRKAQVIQEKLEKLFTKDEVFSRGNLNINTTFFGERNSGQSGSFFEQTLTLEFTAYKYF